MDLEYFIFNTIVFLIFLPGVILIYTFLNLSGKKISISDAVLSGFVLWTFLLIIPSMILGLFTSYVTAYFAFFLILSIALSVLSVIIWFHKNRGKLFSLRKLPISFSLNNFYILYLIPLWAFVALLAFYAPLTQNIDAVRVYLPMARAIVKTGAIEYSPYYLSRLAMAFPPAMPLMYSFMIYLTGYAYVRIIPILLFILTNIAIFKLSETISERKTGIIAVLAFSSMLAPQMLVAIEGLSLDLGYILYTCIGVYAVVKSFKENRAFWIVTAGMACCLAAVSKEFGVATIFICLSILLLNSGNTAFRKLFLLSSVAFFLGIQVFTFPRAFAQFFGLEGVNSGVLVTSFLHRTFILLILLIFQLWIYRIHNYKREKNSFCLYGFLALSSLAFIFYLHNLFTLGVLSAGFSPFSFSGVKVPRLRPVFQPPTINSPLALPYILHIDWYVIFLTAPVGIVYIAPLAIGLYSILSNFKESKGWRESALLVWLVIMLGVFTYLLSLVQSQSYELRFWPSYHYRRLYYFAPLIAIIVGLGVKKIGEKLGVEKVILTFISFLSSAYLFIWLFRQSIELFIYRWIFEVNIGDMIFFPLIFIFIFLASSLIHKMGLSVSTRKVLLGSLLIANLVFPSMLLAEGVSLVYSSGWSPRYCDSVESTLPGLEREGWIEVIEYFEGNVKDNYAVLMFDCYTFVWYTGKPVLDPLKGVSYEVLSNLLLMDDEDAILEKLKDLNLRYFLIPKPDAGERYTLYCMFSEEFKLFSMITERAEFRKIREFSLYDLYFLK